MDIIKSILETILFEIVPIVFLLWLIIARPILEELKIIKEKLDKLEQQSQDHDKPE